MSRYLLRKDNKYEIAVGWDPPLQTYFAQVFDEEKSKKQGEDILLVNAGHGLPFNDVISDIKILEDLLKDYVAIPDIIKGNLIRDKNRQC